ncbi:MAG: ribosome maturation factor RimM [Bacteroides sp.]
MKPVTLSAIVTLESLREVGRLVKVVGIEKGIVAIWLDPFTFADVPHSSGDVLFLGIDGLPVPFVVAEAQERANGTTLLFFDSLDDGITPESLKDFGIYIQYTATADDEIEEDYTTGLALFVGCELLDQFGRSVGRVIDFEQYSYNSLLVVECEAGREVLVPFHPNLVLSWSDGEDAQLQLTIAEGLLDF